MQKYVCLINCFPHTHKSHPPQKKNELENSNGGNIKKMYEVSKTVANRGLQPSND